MHHLVLLSNSRRTKISPVKKNNYWPYLLLQTNVSREHIQYTCKLDGFTINQSDTRTFEILIEKIYMLNEVVNPKVISYMGKDSREKIKMFSYDICAPIIEQTLINN